jgi:predicted nuclease of predicted toxin-antitoxin system
VKLIIDMNLAPAWCAVFHARGWHAVHWSEVGDARAPDAAILSWARTHGHVLLTHDLDFGALLALAAAVGPSVVQVRSQDVTPEAMGAMVVPVLRDHAAALAAGAFISIDEASARVRILPLRE